MIKVDWRLIFYFIPFILVVSIALMNLVTAVIVESAIQQGNADRIFKQKQLSQEFPHFAGMFDEFMEKIQEEKEIQGNFDVPSLTLSDLKRVPDDLQTELTHYMQVDKIDDVFHLLDGDDSGSVDCLEFIEGVQIAVCGSKTVEGYQNQKIMKELGRARRRSRSFPSKSSM